MRLRPPNIAAMLLALIFVGLISACTTQQRIDTVRVATELDEIYLQWDRAEKTIERYAGTLPADAADVLRVGWTELSNVREELKDIPDAMLQDPLRVERLYWRARSAYIDIRGAVKPHIEALDPQDQFFVRRLDRSAQRLDEAAQRLLASADGEAQVVLEMISLIASTARVVGRIAL